jgi:cell division protease FtsH
MIPKERYLFLNPKRKLRFLQGPMIYVLLLGVILVMVYMLGGPSNESNNIALEYSELLEWVEADLKADSGMTLNEDEQNKTIESVVITGYDLVGKTAGPETISCVLPSEQQFYDDVSAVYENVLGRAASPNEYKFKFASQLPASTPWWYDWIPLLIMVVIFGVFLFVMMRQQSGSGKGGMMAFGKSRARMTEPGANTVTFDDVAGADEEKEELKEIVEFLKAPKRFTDVGARIPKGVLLVGPPGTGKTLLARAVSGEACVPFFTISGSDFVEMFVGVGASRVRDLFDQAKKNAPAIVFIDEIDAVGRQRGAGLGGGHDEREQTLNQLLVEMDGFTANTGIIVMAATNRADILDPALLRPGRFDRRVTVNYPDVKGREAILKVHARNKPLSPDVDLSVIARRTPYFTGADLENVLNEAAILTARSGGTLISMATVEEAITRVIAGPEKRSRKITEKDKELVAYHEGGHAIVSYYIPECDKVHEITIIPRGSAGGYTMYLPDEDVSYVTDSRLRGQMASLLGGRVAEQLVLGDISTGASSDIKRATEIARGMVTEYGMSEKVGPIFLGSEHEVFLGKSFSQQNSSFSEEVNALIDREVRSLLEEGYARAKDILVSHMDQLHALATLLKEREKLDYDEFDRFMKGEILPAPSDIKEEMEKLRKQAAENLNNKENG